MFQLLRDGRPRTRADLATAHGAGAVHGRGARRPAHGGGARRPGRRGDVDRRPPARDLRVQPVRPRGAGASTSAPRTPASPLTDLASAPSWRSASAIADRGRARARCSTAWPRPAPSCCATAGRPAQRARRRRRRPARARGARDRASRTTRRSCRAGTTPTCPAILGAAVPRAGARGQRRQHHGPRRAHASAWPDVDHLLFVKVATGIGAGIISDGALRRGAQGCRRRPRARRRPRRHRRRRAGAATSAAWRPIASGPADRRTRLAGADDASADVVALVRGRRRRRRPRGARRPAGDIGEVLAACVSMLNPSVIVIGGILADAGEHLWPASARSSTAVPAPGDPAPAHRRGPHQARGRRARRERHGGGPGPLLGGGRPPGRLTPLAEVEPGDDAVGALEPRAALVAKDRARTANG